MRRLFKNRFFTVSVSLTLLLIAAALFAAFTGSLSVTRQAAMDAAIPGQRFFTDVYMRVSDFIYAYTRYDSLKSENDALLLKISQLERENRRFTELTEENEALRIQLGLEKRNEHIDYFYARAAASDAVSFENTLTLACGTEDEIQPKMAVVTPHGLLGFVKNCTERSCSVSPLAAVGSVCAARTVRAHCTGIIEGSYELMPDGNVRMNYISESGDIRDGDIVETSGIDGVYPSGILIGTVSGVFYEEHTLSRYAVIEPFQKPFDIRYAYVITGFREG